MVAMPSMDDLLGWLRSKMLPVNDRPSRYCISPAEKMFIRQFRQDLTASDVPTEATGIFRLGEILVPKSQVFVIKAFIPYAMERTDAGGVTESARYILPQDGNDWFTFTPLYGDEQTILISTDFNAPQTIAGPPLDTQRQRGNGITQVSVTPYYDALQSFANPFFSIAVPGGQKFKALFQLTGPAAGSNPIPNPYVIGNPTPPAQNKRVDFAGVYVAGVQLPEDEYNTRHKAFLGT